MTDTATSAETGEVLTEEEAIEYAKIDRVIKKFTPRKDELNAKIKRIFKTKGKRIIGPVIISVTERAANDRAAAEKKYPFAKYPHLYETKPVFQYDSLTDKQKKPFQGIGLSLSVDIVAEDSPTQDAD